MVLWCYLIWYCVTVYFYFDSSWRIWLNSAGISVVIGIALMLSVSNAHLKKPDHWQTFRLFATPFCVSSFSSLTKGNGFILFIPPQTAQLLVAIAACASFVVLVFVVKWHAAHVAA
ncbi:MAG: hypothetical protein IPM53_12195 [Anaerolineaceae bacterium]|nr:hypothetical protein [Anaerolineaceae bacterium]